MNDEQRLVFLQGFLKLLLASAYKDEPLLKMVEQTFRQVEALFQNPPSKRGGVISLGAAGERLDAAVRSLRNRLLSIIDEFFAQEEEEKYKEAKKVEQTIFPEGLAAIIYLSKDGEIAATKAFLNRCEPLKASFQTLGLASLLALVEKCLAALSASVDEKAKPTAEPQNEDMIAARKSFQGALVDLKRYLKSRFAKGGEAEKAFHAQIFALLKQSEEASA